MSDLKLTIQDNNIGFDLSVLNADLETGSDLETAVYISIFTWARAKSYDDVPDRNNIYGFFGDKLLDDKTHITGSRLYLLKRRKLNQETINDAVIYVEEALNWMLKDAVVSKIEVIPERKGIDELDMIVRLYRNGGVILDKRFDNLWQTIAGDDNGKFN